MYEKRSDGAISQITDSNSVDIKSSDRETRTVRVTHFMSCTRGGEYALVQPSIFRHYIRETQKIDFFTQSVFWARGGGFYRWTLLKICKNDF